MNKNRIQLVFMARYVRFWQAWFSCARLNFRF